MSNCQFFWTESRNGLLSLNAPPDWEECIVFAVNLWLIHCDRDFILTLAGRSHSVGNLKGLGGTDEGFHSHGPPRGFFSLFACLCRFKPNHNPPKRSQASEILNPKRDLLHSLCLLSSLGVEEAIHWNSIFFFCPLKSQYGVRKPLPVHSCHALLLSLSPPLDMHDVCLLINLCSKNGTEREMSGVSRKWRSWWHKIFIWQ